MRTALHVAVSFNQEHVVEYLLKEGKIKENVEDRYISGVIIFYTFYFVECFYLLRER